MVVNGESQNLETGSTVLGVFEPLPFIEEGCHNNLDDFLLYCYTDGVTETFDDNHSEFGLDNLIKLISENHHDDLDAINEKLVNSLNTFRGTVPHNDDITILSCRVKN